MAMVVDGQGEGCSNGGEQGQRWRGPVTVVSAYWNEDGEGEGRHGGGQEQVVGTLFLNARVVGMEWVPFSEGGQGPVTDNLPIEFT